MFLLPPRVDEKPLYDLPLDLERGFREAPGMRMPIGKLEVPLPQAMGSSSSSDGSSSCRADFAGEFLKFMPIVSCRGTRKDGPYASISGMTAPRVFQN